MSTEYLQVAEIFSSIHGEVNGHHQGRMVTFIRLSGCNLSCFYCDTKHTQDINYGKLMSVSKIIENVNKEENTHVCITGGEPLLQDISILLEVLYTEGYKVSIETNGSIDITPYFEYDVSFVIDYKCLSSGHDIDMKFSNYTRLRKNDVIKFVIANENDIAVSKNFLEVLNEETQCNAIIAFSPLTNLITSRTLYNLIRKYKIKNAVLSVQIHKLIEFS